jgi:SAM-dependent methyltransferase
MFRGGFIRRPFWRAVDYLNVRLQEAKRRRQLERAAKRIAQEQNVSGAIHQQDHLLQYILTHSGSVAEHGPDGPLREYFVQGACDAQQALAVMREVGHAPDSRVLEFASGYGRVTRHLRLPNLTACDIHSDAVTFLNKNMGVRAIRSTDDPSDFKPGAEYDFIFVLSLFSHLPDHLFGPWLEKLYSLLAPGGHLMFTTCGETAVALNPLLASSMNHDTGITFLSMSDQPDLELADYGTSVVSTEYVRARIARCAGGQLTSFRAGAWWRTQDEWIVTRA